MANFAAKYSFMTQEMVDSFCESFYIPAEVHPTAPGRGKTITQFPVGKVGALEKDPAPHLTARQEQTVKLLEAIRLFSTEMGLFDFIKTADPRKVQAVEVQKGDDQVNLLESTQHCFMSLVVPDSGGSSSAAVAGVSVPTEEWQKNVAPEDAYLELTNPDEGTTASDVLPAKRLRIDHPTLVSGTGGKTLAGLEQIRPVGSRLPDRDQLAFSSVAPSSQESEGFLDSFSQANLRIRTTVESFSTLGILVDTIVVATTSTRAAAPTKFATDVNPNLAGPSQPEESEGSDDSFYEPPTLDPSEAKRWYVPRWNITNDSMLDDGFSCRTLVDRVAPPSFFSTLRIMDYDQLYTEFNVGAARQVCLGAEVRSRAEHELKLKEKLRAKYTARGRLLEEKDLEILKLKSQLAEKEVEATEVIRLRDQVSSLSEEKFALTAEVSVLKVTVTQKDHDISLLNSRATCLASTLDDAKVACAEAGNKITSLASERDRLAFEDFKERMEIQQEEQAQELYNRVAELEAHVIDVSGRLEGEFYPTYLTTLAGRRWLLTHGIQLALLECLKSPEYQGTLGYALGQAVDFGMQKGLEAGYEHGTAGRSLSAVDAYNPESKKDAVMDEVLDCFLLDGPVADLPKAAYLQPCIEQLSIPIYHAGDKTAVGETSLSFALMNVHARAEGAKKHDAALRQLMMEIVSTPLSSQTWVGEVSSSVAPLHVEDYDEEDTDEAPRSVVAVPKLEVCLF
ncbi:hypothetical protein Tco_0328345 [Tanacetum coccineum]